MLMETLRNVRANGRTPLIVSSNENPIEIQNIVAAMGERQTDVSAQFDAPLRALFKQNKFEDWP